MDAFLTYAEYTDDYKGASVPEAVFERTAKLASVYVNYATCERAEAVIADGADTELIGKIKGATAEVIDALWRYTDGAIGNGEADGRTPTSETVGAHSISYGKSGAEAQESGMTVQQLVTATLRPWLAGTGIMYRGF